MSKDKSKNQDKSVEIEFFDAWAKSPSYIKHGHFTPFGRKSIVKAFEKLIGEKPSHSFRALDLGCGPGAFTRYFSEYFQIFCFGVDISFGLLKVAKDQGGAYSRYVLSDIENLAIKDESFEIVIFSGVLHHFPEKQRCLKEALRVLKKGGYLIAYDPNVRNPFMWFYKEFTATLFSKDGQTDNEKLFNKNEITSELEKAGFINVRVHAISGVAFQYVGSSFGRLLLPIYNLVEIIFGIFPFSKIYGSFLVTYGQK